MPIGAYFAPGVGVVNVIKQMLPGDLVKFDEETIELFMSDLTSIDLEVIDGSMIMMSAFMEESVTLVSRVGEP